MSAVLEAQSTDWVKVTLDEVAMPEKGSIRRGPFGGSLKKEIFVPEGYKVYEQKNAIYDDFERGHYFINESKYQELSGFSVKPGDILISCAGTLGRVAVAPENAKPGIINQALMRIRPNPQVVSTSYLKRFLQSAEIQRDFFGSASGSAIKNVKAISELKTASFLLPPLSEQKRIAGILDKADAIRRKRQQAIGLTEQFLRSTFLDMFGDPVTNPHGYPSQTLGEICTDLQNGIGKNKEAYGTGEKVANIGDLYKWHTFSPVKFSLLDVTPKETAKYKLERGDLLFVRSSLKREGVAYCSAYDSDETCLFSSFMIRARPDQSLVEPRFLSLQLRTPALRLRLINAANTSTITNISQDGLATVEVLVPPVDRQGEFLVIMKKAEAMIVRAQSRALDYDNLFNSLVQRAFRGEL